MNSTSPSSPPTTAELSRARSELAQKQSEQLDAYLQALRNLQNSQRQRRRKRRWRVPNCWRRTVKTCRRTSPPSLRSTVSSPALNQQAQRMDLVASQQRQATNQTLQVRRVKHSARAVAVAGLLQSAGRSPARVARLPERPRPQQLDTEMAQLRVQRLRFEDLLSKQPQLRQIRRRRRTADQRAEQDPAGAAAHAERAAELRAAATP